MKFESLNASNKLYRKCKSIFRSFIDVDFLMSKKKKKTSILFVNTLYIKSSFYK